MIAERGNRRYFKHYASGSIIRCAGSHRRYYVTAFLMTKKPADMNGDGEEEEALIAIDNQAFDSKVSYTNIYEPSAPASVTLQASGNEVMRAQWSASNGADGYAVRIYEEKGRFMDGYRLWI